MTIERGVSQACMVDDDVDDEAAPESALQQQSQVVLA